MILDNFTAYDLQLMISDEPLGFFRNPQAGLPAQAANDNDGDKPQTVNQKN